LQDGRDAHFLFLPDGEDPDTIVQARGHAGFQDLLANRQSIMDFLYDHLAEDIDMGSIGGKAALAEKAKPLLETIPRSVYKQLATRRLETLIGLSMGSEHAGAQQRALSKPVQHNSTNLTAMSRAVLLALQHPAMVSRQTSIEQHIDESIRGSDVLLQIIRYCHQEPGINTARLLERFRESPNHGFLTTLAVKPYWPDNRELDEQTAETEFAHSLQQLQARSLKTDASKVDASARTGLLSIPKKK